MRRTFTLIELLVVLTMSAMIGGMVFVAMNHPPSKPHALVIIDGERVLVEDIRQIRSDQGTVRIDMKDGSTQLFNGQHVIFRRLTVQELGQYKNSLLAEGDAP